MRLRVIPGPTLLVAVATVATGVLLALIGGLPRPTGRTLAIVAFTGIVVVALVDWLWSRRAWHAADVQMRRALPAAFAVGVHRNIEVTFAVQGSSGWKVRFYDYTDPTLATDGLPAKLTLAGNKVTAFSYSVMPTRRGDVRFAPGEVRVSTRLAFWEDRKSTRLNS